MTNTSLPIALAASVLFVGVLTLSAPAEAQRYGRGGGGGQGCGPGIASQLSGVEASPLDAAETEALRFLREEEKLARDVYITLGNRWGLPIFSNISSAEQRHMGQILMLLERYEIADPVVDDTVGVFTNARLSELYDSLVEQGSVSLTAALSVGAAIEDMDLADLEELLETTDNADIELVARNLARGSRNHLRAFMGQLEAQGGSYAPQHISQQTFETILSSAWERGSGLGRGGGGQGRGNGRGRGNGWGRGRGGR